MAEYYSYDLEEDEEKIKESTPPLENESYLGMTCQVISNNSKIFLCLNFLFLLEGNIYVYHISFFFFIFNSRFQVSSYLLMILTFPFENNHLNQSSALIKNILANRNNAVQMIVKYFRKYTYRMKSRRKLLISRILKKNNACLYI
jgi:hypothetical protein